MLTVAFLKNATRIGVAGALADARCLFEIAAEQAATATGARLELVWLAGVNSVAVDGRVLVASSSAVAGRSDVEVEVSLSGASRIDVPAIRAAMIDIIQRLA